MKLYVGRTKPTRILRSPLAGAEAVRRAGALRPPTTTVSSNSVFKKINLLVTPLKEEL